MHNPTRNKHLPRKRVSIYASPLKKGERACCFNCNAVYEKGRWQWETTNNRFSNRVECPACMRIRRGDAAGRVVLHGSYYIAHQVEIDNLVRNVESAEKSTHPLERIMYCNTTALGTEVLTTGIHLARRISEAVQAAHKGNLSYRKPSSSQLRAYWQRDIVSPT